MIPIFIITCDRLGALKQSIQSYHDNIASPFRIVIVDFGSTYGPTVKFLKHLESRRTRVYWRGKIDSVGGLNSVNECVQDYFGWHPESNYVVTDPDIALDNVKGDILEVYSHLLKKLRNASVVGPMLRIDDIPDYYPQKERVVKDSWHTNFHQREINTIEYGENEIINFVYAPIDTTFGMARAGKRWVRPMRGARVLSPYSARHLDWYLDPENLTPDQEYYMKNASNKIAHWSMWK